MIRSRNSLLFLLVILTSATVQISALAENGVSGPKQRFGAQDAQRILAAGCQMLRTTADFPTGLKAAFARITNQSEFALADPGAPYQSTDVIHNPKLPFRRLVLAGRCQEFWFIHYEEGGRGHSYAVVLFRDNPNGDPTFVWGGRGFTRASSIGDLRTALAQKLFSDDLPFHW